VCQNLSQDASLLSVIYIDNAHSVWFNNNNINTFNNYFIVNLILITLILVVSVIFLLVFAQLSLAPSCLGKALFLMSGRFSTYKYLSHPPQPLSSLHYHSPLFFVVACKFVSSPTRSAPCPYAPLISLTDLPFGHRTFYRPACFCFCCSDLDLNLAPSRLGDCYFLYRASQYHWD